MRLRGAREVAAQTKAVAGSMKGMAATAAASTGAAARGFKDMLPSMARVKSAGMAMKQTGSSMTSGLTLPIVAMGGASVYAAMKWESAFAGVRKTVTATEPELKALEGTIRNMALEIPVSANELANIAEAAGQLGIKTKNIADFTKTMAMMGEATNLSSTVAAEELARFANITGMSQTKFDRLGSTIVKLGNNLAATESDIVSMGMRIAGAGNQVGLSEHQIMAFAGGLSSVGINAEAGGSAISQAFLKANSSVIAGGEELEKWAKTAGMSSASFKRAWNKDAGTAMISFMENLKKMKGEGKDVSGALKDLGLSGIRVQDMMMRGAGAGDLLRESLKLGKKEWRENTALQKEAEERFKTFESRLQLVKNSIYETGIVVGNALLPPLLAIFEFIGPKIRAFANWFADLPGPVKTVAVAFGVVLAAAGPLLTMFGAMALGIAAVNVALGFLAANPIILIIAAIVALGVGLYVAYQKVGWFRDGVDAVFGFLKTAVVTTINFVKQHWQTIVAVILGPVAMISFAVIKNWDRIKSATVAAWNFVKNKITGAVKAVIGFIRNHWRLILSILGGPVVAAVLLVQKNFGKIKSAASNVVSGVKSAFSSMVGFIGSIPGRLASAGAGMFNFIKESFRGAINFVISAWNNLEFKIPGFDPPGPGPKFGGITIGTPDIPLLAKGGAFAGSGWSIVGDKGPELMHGGVGARVVPLPRRSRSVAGAEAFGDSHSPLSGPAEIHTHVYVDGREVALAVAKVGENERALR